MISASRYTNADGAYVVLPSTSRMGSLQVALQSKGPSADGADKDKAEAQPEPSDLEKIAYVDAIRRLQECLREEQAKARALRSQRADYYSRKSGLEEFFLQCIDESRKQLGKGR